MRQTQKNREKSEVRNGKNGGRSGVKSEVNRSEIGDSRGSLEDEMKETV